MCSPIRCPPGTYNQLSGQIVCTACEGNSWTATGFDGADSPGDCVDDNGDKGGERRFMAEAVAAHTPFLQVSNNVVAGQGNDAIQVALAAVFAEEQDVVRAAKLTDVVDKARMMRALE